MAELGVKFFVEKKGFEKSLKSLIKSTFHSIVVLSRSPKLKKMSYDFVISSREIYEEWPLRNPPQLVSNYYRSLQKYKYPDSPAHKNTLISPPIIIGSIEFA